LGDGFIANIDVPARCNGGADHHIFTIDHRNGVFHFLPQGRGIGSGGSLGDAVFDFAQQIQQAGADLVLGQVGLGMVHDPQADLPPDIFKTGRLEDGLVQFGAVFQKGTELCERFN